MAEYLIQSETLDNIADAINAKTGGSSAMTPAQMVTAIDSISGGGEKVLTKLYEADVSEAVRSIIVPITSAIQNCKEFVFACTNLTFSADDWLGITINGNLLYCNPKAQNQGSTARILFFSDSITVAGMAIPVKPLSVAINGNSVNSFTTQVSNWSNINDGISSISIGTYTGNTDITAGHIEIWGWV